MKAASLNSLKYIYSKIRLLSDNTLVKLCIVLVYRVMCYLFMNLDDDDDDDDVPLC